MNGDFDDASKEVDDAACAIVAGLEGTGQGFHLAFRSHAPASTTGPSQLRQVQSPRTGQPSPPLRPASRFGRWNGHRGLVLASYVPARGVPRLATTAVDRRAWGLAAAAIVTVIVVQCIELPAVAAAGTAIGAGGEVATQGLALAVSFGHLGAKAWHWTRSSSSLVMSPLAVGLLAGAPGR